MEYLRISWNIMECHGISWNIWPTQRAWTNTPEASKAQIWARRHSRGYPDLRLLGGVSWITLAYVVNHIITAYYGMSWSITEYHGISWNNLEYHGISWNLMEYRGISWNIIEYHGISWNILEYHGIS